MPKAILHERQHVLVLSALGKEEASRGQPGLLEPWRVKVEAAHHPQHPGIRRGREPRGNTRQEERCCGFIAQRRCGRRDLVKGGGIQPVIGQAIVDGGKVEGPDGCMPRAHVGNAFAQARQGF